MTAATQPHPERDQLMAFGLGRLEPALAENIESHLEQCPTCCDTLLNLGDDTFAALVRKSSVAAAEAQTIAVPGTAGEKADAAGKRVDLPRELREHARYEIVRLLGRGGMGDVFLAQHKLMNRPVALKVIKPELVRNDAAVRRFQREVQAAARLHHKHIVTAYDAEQAGNLHFLVMEYVDGVNLDEVVRTRGPLPVAEACDYLRQAAEGLQHAHELGMVHRDIKPHNLMLSSTGVVKILDFGLANFANEVAAEELSSAPGEGPSEMDSSIAGASILALTQMGTMMGTPDYIAPEQAKDAHAADIRADIYSLGCTFFTLLTGKAPFGQGSALEKIKAHSEREAPALRELRSDISPEVEAVVQRMMAKDPRDRYQTPQEVVDALTKLIDARIEEKLRDMGLDRPPPPKLPLQLGFRGDDPRDWYIVVADLLWGAALIDLVVGLLMAALVGSIVWSGEQDRSFVSHPAVLLIMASIVPGAILLPVALHLRRRPSLPALAFAVALAMLPSAGAVIGVPLGYMVLLRLFQRRYREPLGLTAASCSTAVLALLLAPLLLLGTAAAYYWATNRGTLVVITEDTRATVTVLRGDGVKVATLANGRQNQHTINLPAGDYNLKIIDSAQPMELSATKVIIGRGMKVEVQVRLAATSDGPVVVTLMKDGRYVLNDIPAKDAAEFKQRLKDMLAGNPDREVSINTAEPFGIEPVKQLQDLVRQAGAKQVRLPAWVGSDLDPQQPSRFFTGLGDLSAIVRKHVDETGATQIGPTTIEPNHLRYAAHISRFGSVGGVNLLERIEGDLKDRAKSADVSLTSQEERGLDARLFSYLTPSRRGEVLIKLTEIPPLKGMDARLEIDVLELPKTGLTPNEVFVHYIKDDAGATLRLDGEKVSRDELLKRLKEMAERNSRLQVLVDGNVTPLGWDMRTLMADLAKTGVPERNVKLAPAATQRLLDEAVASGKASEPSKFFQSLGDLQAIVRKTLDDEGLRLMDVDPSGNAAPKRVVFLKAEVMGESERQGKIFDALINKLRTLAKASDAFISSVSQSGQGKIDRYHMSYTTPSREGTIQLERAKLRVDKRMPAIWTWTVIVRVEEWPKASKPSPEPLTIGMNEDFGMLFQGQLVAPAELGRRLDKALKENPEREVVIDLPKRKWTVAEHVDQLEQIARIAGAKHLTRPDWSQIRVVFGVQKLGAQTLDIRGPAYSASGFLKSYLPNVREVIAKNPNLPVLLDVGEDVDLTDPQIAEGLEEVRRVAEEAGAKVRVGRGLP